MTVGLLASVIGGLVGSNGSASLVSGVLSGLLGDGQTGGMGGQSGFVLFFKQGGLGHIAQSRVSNGPSQLVSPQQLQGSFG